MNLLKRILYVLIILIILMLVNITIVNAKTVEITTETLNLRKEATTESDIVALISIGDECEVLGEEGDWYEVKYKEYTGYISKEYTKVIGSDTNENETDIKNENKTNTVDNDDVLDEDSVNNQTNSIISNTENSQDSTSEENEDNQTKSGKVINQVEVKILPLINGSVIETLKKGTEVTIISQLNGWSYIQTDTISGWIRTDNISSDEKEGNSNVNGTKNDESNTTKDDEDIKESSFTEKTMYATDYVNIRKEPNTSSDKLMVVSLNTELKVIGETGDWYKVSTSLGDGYVSKELLSDKKTTVTNRGTVNRTEDKTNEGEEKNTSTSNLSKEEETVTSKTSEIVSYAKKFLGVPYVYGGASSLGFDCSGFTMYVYKHFGISMAHGAQSQAKLGKKITADKSSKSSLLNNLKAGDLVFFLDYETMDEIGHCGIYIGDGNFIHASSGSGYCVKINSLLPGEYYNTRYCAARRII